MGNEWEEKMKNKHYSEMGQKGSRLVKLLVQVLGSSNTFLLANVNSLSGVYRRSVTRLG